MKRQMDSQPPAARAALRRLPRSLKTARLVWLVCCLMAATTVALGCAWILTSDHAVRFNHRPEREFTRLPRLPLAFDSAAGEGANALATLEYFPSPGEDEAYAARERRAAEIASAWEQAEEAEENGDLAALRRHLQQYLRLTAVKRDVVKAVGDRNAALDRLDALTALDQGARAQAVRAHLAARRAFDRLARTDRERTFPDPEHKAGLRPETKEVSALLGAVPATSALRDNVAYLRAALLYEDAKDEEAIRAFSALAAHHPRGEKREAALFMVGLINLKRSRAYTAASGDDGGHKVGEDSYRTAARVIDDERAARLDAAYHAAREAFERVSREYPRGRYFPDARGWIAYLDLRRGDRVSAMAEYYRLLAGPDVGWRVEAAVSLSLVRAHTDNEQMLRLEAELEDEPETALTYAYHSLYNYAANPVCDSCWVTGDRGYYDYGASKQREREAGREEVRRVAAFAARMLKRYPHARIGGAFALRLAQAQLEGGDNQQALAMSRRALGAGVSGEGREQALLVRAFAEQRLRDFAAARRTLDALLREFPQGELNEDARRLAAMAAEDAGDFGVALEQYLALGYREDAAYLIDVLMTPEQLAAFVARRPQSEPRDVLLYSLGVRYLHAGRWDDARAALRQVRTSPCEYPSYREYQFANDRRYAHAKDAATSDDGVCADWVLGDLKTADDLEGRERLVEMAQGDEARAEAMYQLASYQFEACTLTFYNPALWNFRYLLLSSVDENQSYRLPNEARTLWEYSQAHEPVARALRLYLEVVRRYPQTRAARDALYTAAVCHERLGDYNAYWRGAYARGLHAGDRLVTYADVRAAYPQYQLPRGTYGWEPVTRTVNGGPGWHAPLKPSPRPRLAERVRLGLQSGVRRANESMIGFGAAAWTGYVRPGLLTLLAVAGVLCLWYAVILTAHFIGRRNERLSAEVLALAGLEEGARMLADAESRVERVINPQD
jgi:outer membrane protein assembly factor BamD (BamD/ComL family)